MRLILTTSPHALLRTLLWLRALAIAGQAVAVQVAVTALGIALPAGAMMAVTGGLAVFALLTAVRLRAPWPATQIEVALQLLVDIAALTALLYLSGGATNPFSSLYLVPIALAAVGLGRRYAIGITVSCAAAYALLMRAFTPLHYPSHNAASEFNLHILGMAVNFGVSALLLTVFLMIMNREMRGREHDLARLREETLRREHVTAIGLLAAGAAHELSTPLSTMAILASELKDAVPVDSPARADIDLLRRQIHVCKERLNAILRNSGQERAPEARAVDARCLVVDTVEAWRVVHSGARVDMRVADATRDARVRIDDGFAQALINLLTNALQASVAAGSDRVIVTVDVHRGGLAIFIDDEGCGIDESLCAVAGKSFVSGKSDGYGLGLVLSNANLNRLGGEVTLTNRRGGGTRTAIRLPLAAVETLS